MRAALADLNKATNIRQLFYFTHIATLDTADILILQWIDGNGHPCRQGLTTAMC